MTLFALNEGQTAIRDATRDFARRRIAPGARERDAQERFPGDILQEMAGLGLMGVNIPASLGGTEAGVVAYALAMMEVAEADASTAVTMAVNNMVAEIIVRFGTTAQQQAYVPRICDGSFQGAAFALSEAHSGSDPGAMRTTAERRDNRWILNGSKQWITNGSHAGVYIVWARTSPEGNKGISAFLVEGGTRGLSAGKPEEKMGLRGSNTVSLTFEDVEIPESALLATIGAGFRIAMVALDGGRIGIASQALGIGRAALAAAVAYSKERTAFGQPIATYEATQWKVADMATELAAAELLTLRAAARKEERVPFTREASMAKLFSTEAANRAVAHAFQIHGGYGYVKEYPVERYFRDARVTTVYEGTSEIQRLVIARELLKESGADDRAFI
jgi:alkylation response protein AidB-like acyl-CoA dehydrogenase